MVSLSQSPIQIITHIKDNPNSLVNNNVNYIIESTDGNIWYATDRGISIYNPRTGIWRNSLSGIVVVSLCEDGNGNVLAGCYGDGVYRIDLSGNIKGHWTQAMEPCHRTISSQYRLIVMARYGSALLTAAS